MLPHLSSFWIFVIVVCSLEIIAQDEHTQSGEEYLERVFHKYESGDGGMNLEGFSQLMQNLGLGHHHDDEHHHSVHRRHIQKHKWKTKPKRSVDEMLGAHPYAHNHSYDIIQCVDSSELWQQHGLSTSEEIEEREFLNLCPSLIYQLDNTLGSCSVQKQPRHHRKYSASLKVWVYALISVLVISLCGMFGVAVVPIMQLVFYHQILQFFVALAVGSLSGDALLHLLPHALTSTHGEDHHVEDDHGHGDERQTILKGLAALTGFFFFFLTEKLVAVLAECRDENKNRNKVIEMENQSERMVGKKLSKHHQYTTYSYNLQDVGLSPKQANENNENCIKISEDHHNCLEKAKNRSPTKLCNSNKTPDSRKPYPDEDKSHVDHSHEPLMTLDDGSDGFNKRTAVDLSPVFSRRKSDESVDNNCKTTHTVIDAQDNDEESRIIITRHENMHHGHSHAHGHVHSRPNSMAAVAWMVILGDGIHNFTDGLIIGAAFGNSITGGLSTSIAVFCHELPHEIGDFAVLLKTGMTWKQALFYNGISSILCLCGMIVGICLGTMEHIQPWIFALAAGMFLYIALVDMVPELNNLPPGVRLSPAFTLAIQCAGMLLGMAIMLTIAFNEHALMNLFNEQ